MLKLGIACVKKSKDCYMDAPLVHRRKKIMGRFVQESDSHGSLRDVQVLINERKEISRGNYRKFIIGNNNY